MSDLVDIPSPHIPDLHPRIVADFESAVLDYVDLDDLKVNRRYQREADSPASIRSIRAKAEAWSKLLCAPIVVAIVPDGIEIVDGQHRAIAAKLLGIKKLPAFIIDGTTLTERAGAFVAFAKDRLPVTPGQIFRAQVTAGDEDAVAVHRIATEAGVRILPYSQPFGLAYQAGDTVALASIKTIARRHGADKTREILTALVAAGLAPIGAQHIRAGEALLCEPEYQPFTPEQLTTALLGLGPRLAAEVRTLAAAKGLPAWRAMVAVLFKGRDMRRPRPVEQGQVTTPTHGQAAGSGGSRAGSGATLRCDRAAPAETDSTALRAPGKGDYRASAPSAAATARAPIPLAPNARIIDRRASGPVNFGDPPPGRSALDQRRAGK